MPTHLSNAEIASRLYVSRHTVKTQMISIDRKLGANSRRGAVDLAATADLVDTRSPGHAAEVANVSSAG